MKILYLADGNSIHTQKWVNGLLSKKYEIFLFSLNDFNINDYDKNERFEYESMNLNVMKSKFGSLNKIKYFSALSTIRSIINNFKPDIIHAHFASSYGLLGVLSGARPLITSVWGNDVFNFPEQSFIHKALIKYVFNKSKQILSTSEIMAKQTSKYTDKNIIVTPFGIDLTKFKPLNREDARAIIPFKQDDIVIGTVKLLEKKYGIDYMLKAFTVLKNKHVDLPLKCCIVGYGSEEENLKELSRNLGIKNDVYFSGKVPNEQVPVYLNSFDIYMALSIEDSESFGVAIIEAGACGIPVIVTDVGGLPEVVDKDRTGIVVKKKNVEQTVEAMEKLVLNKDLRIKYGLSGLERVKIMYDWNNSLEQMHSIYCDIKDL